MELGDRALAAVQDRVEYARRMGATQAVSLKTPRKERLSQVHGSAVVCAAGEAPVNVNTATASQLEELPGRQVLPQNLTH